MMATVVFNKRANLITDTLNRVKTFSNNYIKSKTNARKKGITSGELWKPPCVGFLKLNLDEF